MPKAKVIPKAKGKKSKSNKSDNPQIKADIRAINEIRKELGKGPLPINNNKWYTDICTYAETKYGANMQLAVKMIGSTITSYTAKQFNDTKGRTTAKLNAIVTKQRGMANHTLDECIRAQDMNWFDSLQYNEMNHVQEAMLDAGQLDFRQASVKVVETKLSGIRPR